MRKLTYIIILLAFAIPSNGQTLDSLLKSIERNNPVLVTQQKWLEAEEANSKTGNYIDNPEITYNYLWGNQDALGDQKEFEIVQPFRLPGYYTSRSDVKQIQYEKKALSVEKIKQEVIHTARIAYFTLVWLSKKEQILKIRLEESEKLVLLIQEGFERGEISKPAFDKVRIYHIRVHNDWQKCNNEIEAQSNLLRQLNGGIHISDLIYEYPINWIMPELDSLLSRLPDRNYDIRLARFNIAESDKKIKAEKMNSFPIFEAGFKSETIFNQKLQGIHAGTTIPLWENKNQVKTAKLVHEWSKASYLQVESEIRTEVISLYNNTKITYSIYQQMKDIIESEQVSGSAYELLKSGQISFTEYFVEMQFIFDSRYNFLETEKEYFHLMSELLFKANS